MHMGDAAKHIPQPYCYIVLLNASTNATGMTGVNSEKGNTCARTCVNKHITFPARRIDRKLFYPQVT